MALSAFRASNVPLASRESWAERIVEKYLDNNPSLYASIGRWTVMPEEERKKVVNEIISAADQVYSEIIDEE